MSEERRGGGFFSRMFAPQDADETTIYDRSELGAPEPETSLGASRGFGVERAVDIIDDLPSDVPRESAMRIVRHTLEAAGISIEDLGSSARAREAKLESEIQLSRDRIDELKEKTENVVMDLEGQIRKAREARDFGVSQEERKISAARSGLGDVEKVRDFFGLSAGEPEGPAAPEDRREEDEEPEGAPDGDDTQVLRPVNVDDDTRVLRPRGPLSRDWEDEDDREPGGR